MTKRMNGLTRRGLMQGGALLAAAGATLGGGAALAKVEMPNAQAPHWYRFSVGEAKAMVVSDGLLPVGSPLERFPPASPEEVAGMFDSHFLRHDNWILEQNALAITIGGRTVLFDTGLGTVPGYGATPGALLANLRAAGIDPALVDAIVITHAHVDHVAGIMSDSGERHFPNAQIYISEADFDFWTDEGNPDHLSGPLARRNLLPTRDRIVFVKDGEEFIPGITAIHTPGHTVGHMMYMLESGGERLCFTGDLAHHHVVLLERPRLSFSYDTDKAQSAESRVKHLGMLADERIPILAYHFPWPGIGNVVRSGDGFRFIPRPMVLQDVT